MAVANLRVASGVTCKGAFCPEGMRSGPTTGGAEGFDRQPSSTGMMNDWIINAQLPQNIGGTIPSLAFLLNPPMGHGPPRAPTVMWCVLMGVFVLFFVGSCLNHKKF